MRLPRKILIGMALVILALVALPAMAQVATSTITGTTTSTITLDAVLRQSQGVASAFRSLGALAGLTALVNLLVNLTKVGAIDEFIVRRGIKWVRPLLAILSGFLGGLVTAISKDLPVMSALFYAVTGLFAGGGAIALHELYKMIKGET